MAGIFSWLGRVIPMWCVQICPYKSSAVRLQMYRWWFSAMAMVLACSVATSSARAEVDFKGKSIEMIIASNAGGGTDLVGRIFAKYFEVYLPGRPHIIPKNTGAGAGEKILAANRLARSDPNGLTLMQSDSDTLQPTLLKSASVMFEPAELRVIGSVSRGGSIVFIRKDAVSRLKDPAAKPVLVGTPSGQRSWTAMTAWGKEYLGWNIKWVKGYKGSEALALALRRGEIDSFATNGIGVIDPLYKEGVIDYLVQEGEAGGRGFLPRTSFPNVPIFPVLLKQANVPDQAYKAYLSVMGASALDKWLSLPPKTPDEVTNMYRAAFDKIAKDETFLDTMHKQVSKEVYVLGGVDTEKLIREHRHMPAEVTKFAEALRQKHDLLPKN